MISSLLPEFIIFSALSSCDNCDGVRLAKLKSSRSVKKTPPFY